MAAQSRAKAVLNVKSPYRSPVPLMVQCVVLAIPALILLLIAALLTTQIAEALGFGF